MAIGFSWAFKDTISASGIRTGEVDTGSIEITVSATGKVSPLLEEIIVSPVSTRIMEVYKNPGDQVKAGEPLLRLELSSLQTEHMKRLDEREMKQSELVQVRVRLDNAIADLRMQQQVKKMQAEQLDAELQSERYLDSIGASTADKVKRAELAYKEAALQLKHLEQKIENETKNSQAELRAKELELNILEKSLKESARHLENARILAPRNATLTFINTQIGMQVAEGTQLAIISDLTKFKIDAEVADTHRGKIAPGARAIIKAGRTELEGTVVNITPSADNGVLKFTVVPKDAGNSALHSGLKTDINVIYGVRDNVLRVPNDSWFKYGKGSYEVWVVRNGQAEKRRASFGDSSYEYVEVISGLSEGDRMLIQDMEDYKNKTKLKIK